MPKPSRLGRQIEEAFTRYLPHPAGHSEYLLRYVTSNGTPFAVGRTASNGVRFWIPADERLRSRIEAEGFICKKSEPKPPEYGKSATGRNSNLDRIPEFKGKPVFWLKVTTPGDALRVASKLL